MYEKLVTSVRVSETGTMAEVCETQPELAIVATTGLTRPARATV
jgi:hypothetical protein